MKRTTLCFALMLMALAIMGCEHFTNNQIPPPGTELAIVNPTNDAVIDGIVPINVNTTAINNVIRVEFFVNGQLINARTAPPWEFDWNTSTLSSNTFHSIQAKAFGLGSSYAVSQVVTVRIR